MHRFRRILVHLSLDGKDADILNYTAEFARMSHANRIELLHVIPEETFEIYDSDAGAGENWVSKNLEKLMNEQKQFFATNVSPEIQIHTKLAKGNTVMEILKHSLEAEPDLIVLKKDSSNFLFAEKISRKAACAILILEANMQANFKKILLPVDFSEQTSDCIQIASSIAKNGEDCRLFLYHSVEMPNFYPSTGMTLSEVKENLLEKAQRKMQKLENSCEPANLLHETYLSSDHDCWRGIKDFCEKLHPDLIIMGNRGTHSRSKLLLGGNAEQTIRLANSPILIFKKTGTGASVLSELIKSETEFTEKA